MRDSASLDRRARRQATVLNVGLPAKGLPAPPTLSTSTAATAHPNGWQIAARSAGLLR